MDEALLHSREVSANLLLVDSGSCVQRCIGGQRRGIHGIAARREPVMPLRKSGRT